MSEMPQNMPTGQEQTAESFEQIIENLRLHLESLREMAPELKIAKEIYAKERKIENDVRDTVMNFRDTYGSDVSKWVDSWEEKIISVYGPNPTAWDFSTINQEIREYRRKEFLEQTEEQHTKQVVEIENKIEAGQVLTREELGFIYEINGPSRGFGYRQDPRVRAIQKQRSPKEDAPVLFDCEPQEIAHDIKEVNENTRVYIGSWGIEIFQIIRNYPNIKHVYEYQPSLDCERVIHLETSPDIDSDSTLRKAFRDKRLRLWANDIDKVNFSKDRQAYDLVCLTPKQLGLWYPSELVSSPIQGIRGFTEEHKPGYSEISEKLKDFGLETCPGEVGPQLRLQDPTFYYGGATTFGYPSFKLEKENLDTGSNGASKFNANDKIIFRFHRQDT